MSINFNSDWYYVRVFETKEGLRLNTELAAFTVMIVPRLSGAYYIGQVSMAEPNIIVQENDQITCTKQLSANTYQYFLKMALFSFATCHNSGLTLSLHEHKMKVIACCIYDGSIYPAHNSCSTLLDKAGFG